MKKTIPEDHHYVPKFYLNNFSIDGKCFVFDKKITTLRNEISVSEKHTSRIMFHKRLYNLNSEGKKFRISDISMIESHFSNLEGILSNLIRLINIFVILNDFNENTLMNSSHIDLLNIILNVYSNYSKISDRSLRILNLQFNQGLINNLITEIKDLKSEEISGHQLLTFKNLFTEFIKLKKLNFIEHLLSVDETILSIKMFIAIQFWRLPNQEKNFTEVSTNLAQYTVYENQKILNFPIEYRDIIKITEGILKKNKVSSKNSLKFLQYVFLPIMTFNFNNLPSAFRLIMAPLNSSFFISDNPIIYDNINNLFEFKNIYFPLTSKILVNFYQKENNSNNQLLITEADSEFVDFINQQILVTANNLVASNDKNYLHKMVKDTYSSSETISEI